MAIAREAFERLYPGREYEFEDSVKYSARFKGYNGNILRRGNTLQIRLSRNWKEIDSEITIGLVQLLLLKLLGDRKETPNTRLYSSFIKSLHISTEKSVDDDQLRQSFERVSEKYFQGMIEMPRVRWGSESYRKLGSYEYQTDELVVSTLFKAAPERMLDLLMYHELLHKKLKFNDKNGRSYHHTAAFRQLERQFEDFSKVEEETTAFLRRSHRKWKWF